MEEHGHEHEHEHEHGPNIVAFRNYINSAKKVILNALEKGDPNDPNKTHDMGRLDRAISNIIKFGNALMDFFKEAGPIEIVVQNHNTIFKSVHGADMPDGLDANGLPDGLDLFALKRNPSDRATCIFIIENDIKRNTLSTK